MATLLGIMLPLFAGMLIPVWIPMIGVAVGAVLDRVRPAEVTPAMAVVAAAKERSAANRAAARQRPEPAAALPQAA